MEQQAGQKIFFPLQIKFSEIALISLIFVANVNGKKNASGLFQEANKIVVIVH